MIGHFKHHVGKVNSLYLSDDNSVIVSGSRDKTFSVIDVRTQKRMYLQQLSSGANAVLMTHNLRRVITCVQDRKVQIWDMKNVSPEATIVMNACEPTAFALNGNGNILAVCGSDACVYLYDVGTLKCMGKFIAHSDVINSASFSYDDKQLITVGSDNNIMVWNVFDMTSK